MRIRELLLLERDITEAPPCVIVGLVGLESRLITFLAIVVVLIGNKLVAAQGVSICKILIELNGPSEEFQSSLVLLLQTVTVADHAPCLGSEERLLEGLIAQEDQGLLVLEVP